MYTFETMQPFTLASDENFHCHHIIFEFIHHWLKLILHYSNYAIQLFGQQFFFTLYIMHVILWVLHSVYNLTIVNNSLFNFYYKTSITIPFYTPLLFYYIIIIILLQCHLYNNIIPPLHHYFYIITIQHYTIIIPAIIIPLLYHTYFITIYTITTPS